MVDSVYQENIEDLIQLAKDKIERFEEKLAGQDLLDKEKYKEFMEIIEAELPEEFCDRDLVGMQNALVHAMKSILEKAYHQQVLNMQRSHLKAAISEFIKILDKKIDNTSNREKKIAWIRKK